MSISLCPVTGDLWRVLRHHDVAYRPDAPQPLATVRVEPAIALAGIAIGSSFSVTALAASDVGGDVAVRGGQDASVVFGREQAEIEGCKWLMDVARTVQATELAGHRFIVEQTIRQSHCTVFQATHARDCCAASGTGEAA
jgi:hypothetical protein